MLSMLANLVIVHLLLVKLKDNNRVAIKEIKFNRIGKHQIINGRIINISGSRIMFIRVVNLKLNLRIQVILKNLKNIIEIIIMIVTIIITIIILLLLLLMTLV